MRIHIIVLLTTLAVSPAMAIDGGQITRLHTITVNDPSGAALGGADVCLKGQLRKTNSAGQARFLGLPARVLYDEKVHVRYDGHRKVAAAPIACGRACADPAWKPEQSRTIRLQTGRGGPMFPRTCGPPTKKRVVPDYLKGKRARP